MADLTPMREWILNDLAQITTRGVWSNENSTKAIFYQRTFVTHEALLKKWYQFKKDGQPDYSTMGPEPGFTTCTSFLPVFVSKVCDAGKLSRRNFRAFNMSIEKGWSPISLMTTDNGPKEGDFFLQNNSKGQAQHVAVIVQIQDAMWSTVSGGAGGRNAGRDGIKRSQLGPMPNFLVGWVNVDSYFEGWTI